MALVVARRDAPHRSEPRPLRSRHGLLRAGRRSAPSVTILMWSAGEKKSPSVFMRYFRSSAMSCSRVAARSRLKGFCTRRNSLLADETRWQTGGELGIGGDACAALITTQPHIWRDPPRTRPAAKRIAPCSGVAAQPLRAGLRSAPRRCPAVEFAARSSLPAAFRTCRQACRPRHAGSPIPGQDAGSARMPQPSSAVPALPNPGMALARTTGSSIGSIWCRTSLHPRFRARFHRNRLVPSMEPDAGSAMDATQGRRSCSPQPPLPLHRRMHRSRPPIASSPDWIDAPCARCTRCTRCTRPLRISPATRN